MRTIQLTVFAAATLLCTYTTAQIGNFRDYQQTVNKAEITLIAGKKTEALSLYYDLLMSSDGNFAKDIYNALVLAKELNKIDTFFTLLELVKKKEFRQYLP
jgi:hypothetical protein